MSAVGLWAGALGRRALIALPASFLGAMALGFCVALMGSAIPMIEVGIAASVLALGLAVMLNLQPSIVVATLVCGLFGIFHGYAHGAEIASGVSAVDYDGPASSWPARSLSAAGLGWKALSGRFRP